jgi:hypothetical protein
MCAPELIGERLRILKRLAPQLDKIAMALNGQNPNNAAQLELLRSEAQKLGIVVEPLDIRKSEDVVRHSTRLWHSAPRGVLGWNGDLKERTTLGNYGEWCFSERLRTNHHCATSQMASLGQFLQDSN